MLNAQGSMLNARWAPLTFDAQGVLHADNAGNATDDVLGLPALYFGVDDARQKHARVADDDVNRWNGLRGVVGKGRVAIEGVRDDAAEPVVAERGGQHLEVVDEILDAVDVRGAPREILGLDRLRDITSQRDDPVLDANLHVIEHREVRRSPHLIRNALGQLLIAFGLANRELTHDFLDAFDLEDGRDQILLGADAADGARERHASLV